MPENQNIEYKQSWHDDHLKIICGFANASGGRLFLGKDDNGNSVGLPNYNSLLENLPNKIRNHLGITAEVNLVEDNKLYLIEIIVPSYSVAISLRGRYYHRSGSVTSELTGTALSEFLIRKSARTGMIFLKIVHYRRFGYGLSDKISKCCGRSGRITVEADISRISLFEKLRLSDGQKIKRAAIILFGKDPGKFYPNISVKIGRFGNADDDLKFQEVIEGKSFKNFN